MLRGSSAVVQPTAQSFVVPVIRTLCSIKPLHVSMGNFYLFMSVPTIPTVSPSICPLNIVYYPHAFHTKCPDKVQALFHRNFSPSFPYSCTKLNFKFKCFIAAIWLSYVLIYGRHSSVHLSSCLISH